MGSLTTKFSVLETLRKRLEDLVGAENVPFFVNKFIEEGIADLEAEQILKAASAPVKKKEEFKRPEDLHTWSPEMWTDCMLENDYTGQNAEPKYRKKHYEVITGKDYDSGVQVPNRYSLKTMDEINQNPKTANLWSFVIKGFFAHMKENGREIR